MAEHSDAPKSGGDNFGGEHLRQIVARIERLEEEKQALAEDVKQVYAEAKAHGFDTKILRQVIRIRKMDKADRAEQEALLDLYLDALDMRAPGQ
ncbi:DUF2312 domain-containing protein [Marinibaculum pumilum]|uniref:UPF0335 protein ACFOGJ_23575 n=1 Tax=Marinibaculum pumilum TaxID=1766165 RepID=A0ABV7L6K9_9PROT